MLRDVDRVIGDAFDRRSGPRDRDDEAKIGRGGLLQDEHVDAHLIDFELHLVDRVVFVNDSLGQLRVALDQRTHREHDGFLGGAGDDQPLSQSVEAFFNKSFVLGSPYPSPIVSRVVQVIGIGLLTKSLLIRTFR